MRQRDERVEAGQGIVRESSSGEQSRERARAATSAAQATLGPHVGTGEFQGVSAAVSDLPVVVAPLVTTLNTRDNEHLVAQQGSSNAKDPVIQKKRGVGPLSAPIANFDGICLPFGDKPCAEGSSCSCLPPDTNGAAGATQFVQMVNSDFAVYSKTGQVLRHATPIDQLWSAVGGECAAHNDGDPVVVYDQFANRWLLSEFVAQPAAGEDYGECVAISTTNDATGTYNLYFFDWGPEYVPRLSAYRRLARRLLPVGQRVPDGAGDVVRCGGDRARAEQDARRSARAVCVVRRSRGQPGRRPVHRPTAR